MFLQNVLFSMSSPLHQLFPYLLLLNLKIFLPLFLFPGNSIPITLLPTYFLSLLMTCPYHLSLPSLIFIPNCSTLIVPLMYSFLILSFLVTPIANLNIFISATFIFSTCFFETANVSSPYTIAGLTTELYAFLFTLAGNLCRRLLPILFSIHSILLPLSYTVDPKYLNCFTLGLLYHPSSLFLCHFLHLHLDIWSLT